MNRIWDKDNKYPSGYIKSFKHWTFEISYRQHTLGSFILFSNKYHQSISELSQDEITELPGVMKFVEDTYSKIPLLKPDKFNYWQMGNNLKHLHFHGIPRYEKSRRFAGRPWTDKNYGHPPIWSGKDVNDKLVGSIKNLVLSYIEDYI